MNKHSAPIEFRRQTDSLPADIRYVIVRQMAIHLVAGVTGGLDLGSDIDVIDYLWRTPDRFHHRVILDHLDDALLEAKQMLIAAEMSRG